jgi:hypothetical protein
MFDLELMRRLSAAAAVSGAEVDQLRANRERDSDNGSGFEGVSPESPESVALSDADVAALISPEARDIVIGFEVSDRATYERKYFHPEWPKGDSGITIGIGYDVGYVSKDELAKHWGGLISDAEIQRLGRAVGVKGAHAQAILSDFRSVSVPWDAAIAAYERSTMPKFGRLVLRAFPGAIERPGHCFGALFSLVFNRGASLDGERRREMRNIRDACAARSFDKVPGEIRAMKRLWESTGLTGLLKRREAEALLFARGLEQTQVASAAVPTQQAESLQDPRLFDGDGLYADEDEITTIARESGNLWEEVKWPANDDDTPDYQHVSDRALSGKTFEFDGQALEMLIKANSFEPVRDHGRIIFALRGAELVTSLTAPEFMMRQQDRPALTLRDCRPNHKDFRCVVGVYDLTTNRLSGFASSTVPNRGAVAGYYSNQQAGNMMPTGCYRFEVNWHLISKPERMIPGCLVENGRQKCVHRSINNMSYDVEDIWENSRLHGDNLHPAKSAQSAKFSSLGCLVVSGNYDCPGENRERGTHTGEWALFRKALGLTKPGTGDHGLVFDVVLLTGLEAAIANDIVKHNADGNNVLVQDKLGRIRQGSKGERVKRLEVGLGLPPGGIFSHKVVKAWTDRQRRDFQNKAQGAYGPKADAHYGFGVFAPVPVAVAVNASGAALRNESMGGDGDAANLEQMYYEIGLHAEAARRNPSANTSTLESLGGANLEAINLEFGFATLKSAGLNIVQSLEQQLQQRICADPLGNTIGRDAIRTNIDAAAKKGVDALKKQLAGVLTGLVTGVPFVSSSFAERIVDALFERLLRPAAGGLPTVITGQMELSAQWLCQRWCDRLGGTAGSVPTTISNNLPPPVVRDPVQGPTSSIDIKPLAKPAIATASQTPADASRVTQILSSIEQSAAGTSPDGAGVRRYIRDLRSHLRHAVHGATAGRHRRRSLRSDARY